MSATTDELRREADRIGLTWTAGYQLEGRCTDTDTVTTLWPVPGDASQSLTFEEWDAVTRILLESVRELCSSFLVILNAPSPPKAKILFLTMLSLP